MQFWLFLVILVSSFFVQAAEVATVLQTNQIIKPSELGRLQIPKDLKLDTLLSSPEAVRNLQKLQIRQGGDISGGGFGLQIKGTSQVILHDLWCENHKYIFQKETLPRANSLVPSGLSDEQILSGWKIDLKSSAPAELARAMRRLQAWKQYAPELVSEIQKTLLDQNIWNATFLLPQNRALDQFEFPGGAAELAKFHEKFAEIQIARVNRFSGQIYLASGLWDRMDLNSRAGLLVHESLRRLYIRSVKGYLVPSILQWMTGAIMFRDPGTATDDARMVQSFYEELMMSLDNTAVLDKNRPAHWRDELCQNRTALAAAVSTASVEPASPSETLRRLCVLHREMQQEDSRDRAWLNLDSFRQLKSPCDFTQLESVPTYTLSYWLQKTLWIGKTWSGNAPSPAVAVRNIPAVLRSEKSALTTASLSEVIARFQQVGDSYCIKRDDFYGKGQEFVALADILLKVSLSKTDLREMPEPLTSFQDPEASLGFIANEYRAKVRALYRASKSQKN